MNNTRLKSLEEFIEDAIKIHGCRYDYSKSIYKNSRTKIQIGCEKHGYFFQTPQSHLNGHGCKKCGHDIVAKINTYSYEKFIEDAKRIHDNKYNYSKSLYSNTSKKIIIICPIHGEFFQYPYNHLKGHGCSKCGNLVRNKKSIDEFVDQSRKIHGQKYDYKNSIYINGRSKIEIICPYHGSFWQRPDLHCIDGKGCPKCGKIQRPLSNRITQAEFLKRAKEVHGNLYDYSKSVYQTNDEKVEIICSKHGSFFQKAGNHIRNNQGCPKCNFSKGENRVMRYLESKNIRYEYQKKFDDLKTPSKRGWLRFDFFIPNKNTVIEFDGVHHFYPCQFKNHKMSQEDFEYRKKLDNIKDNYANSKGISILRISYKDDVNEKLKYL